MDQRHHQPNGLASVPHRQGQLHGNVVSDARGRHRVEGGLLHLADYDTYLDIAHGSITIFDGQSVVHGVTPLTKVGPGGYRYTTVAYAKRDMKLCAPNPADEARRAAIETTKADDRRLTGYKPHRGSR